MYNLDIITVSGLNMYIKSMLDSDIHLRNIFVEGEISNLTCHYKSGHIYLSLKDNKSVLKAIIFSQNAKRLKFIPSDGMKVICRGRLSVYEAGGNYQLYIEDMQPDGVGALAMAFEQLKDKLSKEGLFDSENKKPLPQLPEKIGVITSNTGAAMHDIINVISRRYPLAELVVYPSLVQGDTAPFELIKGLKYFNKHRAADVIIIGRGGGSYEDLQAFNDETLAREIVKSKIPVISAVGHETDFTICDFASDLRAPTPSAAAELAVPDKEELLSGVLSLTLRLKDALLLKLDRYTSDLENVTTRLQSLNTENILKNESLKLDTLSQRLYDCLKAVLSYKQNNLNLSAGRLESLNPMNVLLRGYCAALKENKAIKSVKEIKKDDIIDVKLVDGTLSCKVNEIWEAENNEQ